MVSLIIDSENSGLTLPSSADISKQPHMFDFAVIRIEDGREVSRHEWFMRPPIELPPIVSKITGVTNDTFTSEMPTFAEYVDAIAEAFRGADALWAHNADYDTAVLAYELRRCGRLEGFPWPERTFCSVQEFSHEFGRRPKLTELFEKKLGHPLEQKHRAMADAEALAKILLHEGVV